MNAIIGMTNLAIIETVKVPLAQEYLQIVNSSAQVLLDLLNEILDYSKLSTGKFTFRYSSFSLRKIIQELCATMRYHAEEKGLIFESMIEDHVHDMLWGDPLRIRQIIMNLLSNSIKFTETGRIDLRVNSTLVNSEESEIKFIIRDTGIGISPNDQERIFAPFAQADSSMTRRHNGTGLGLAITSDLVHAMRGKHELESKVGKGSCFTITIPLRHDINAEKMSDDSSPVSRDVAKMQEEPPNRKLKVLAVEDVRANQILIQRILEKRGHEVIVVPDGSKAVDFLKHQRADLVLMDLQMPVMDGFQACEIIKTIPSARNTRIIAVTAHATDADRQACMNAGMDGYLAKPINFVELLDMVESESK
jgi:CheY-like chemotaxis protein